MRLRNQVLLLSLLTLLLPLAGWKLVQEMENFLREAEEDGQLLTARTIARALPAQYRAELALARGGILPLRRLPADPVIDGYLSDWPQTGQAEQFESQTGGLALAVLAGRSGNRFYLALRVRDESGLPATAHNAGTSDTSRHAGIVLYLQSRRGQHSYMISSEAPGPLAVASRGGEGARLDAAWMDDVDGYTVELELPGDVERVGVGAVAPALAMGVPARRFAGTLDGARQGGWLELVSRDDDIAGWLAGAVPENSRAWLVQPGGWVVADSGPLEAGDNSELSWAGRMLYQAVADSGMQPREDRPPWPVRFEGEPVASALAGDAGTAWLRDTDSAVVYSLVAVPVLAENGNATGQAIGAVVMESRSEGLLLMTNRALGRVSFIALALVLALAAGLWLFATRLSRRVGKLSGAVSRAMDDAGRVPDLPSTRSGDEVGELARNTEKLLKAVADYTAYLQELAGRLSHELKTPIAITRSSLENLASTELAPDSRQYLARAREGLDRQAAIVAAMSEAQRLEGAVRTAEWVTIDLGEMLGHSVEGYRAVHRGREIALRAPAEPVELRCAPDLLAQALDKLVDNAVSLGPPDCEVTVSLAQRDGECLLGVTNTGTLLPDVAQEQLFDSLVSIRDKKAGRSHLGLGLHIVRLVAEAHGGSVGARNLPDRTGVEFTIRLPMA